MNLSQEIIKIIESETQLSYNQKEEVIKICDLCLSMQELVGFRNAMQDIEGYIQYKIWLNTEKHMVDSVEVEDEGI